MYKIAFFGSDLFSLASFKEVLNLGRSRPDLISSVSLVTRQLKQSGRGMKNVHKPEIVQFAESENLNWYEVESHDHFNELQTISNLAIAVSYGRLIPASYLQKLPYGGLNVHPSRLPQYRGASPLQYAIMDRLNYTGVSVQTLHPTKFDHGEILWRSQNVKLEDRETTESLTDKLGHIGAKGLVEVLTKIDLTNPTPLTDTINSPLMGEDVKASKAPVINRKLSQIDFSKGALDMDARGRALGKLYFRQHVQQKKPKRGKPKGHPIVRVNLSQFSPVYSLNHLPETLDRTDDLPVGTICSGKNSEGQPLLCLKLKDGYLGAAEVTVEGNKPEPAEQYFLNLEKRRLQNVEIDT